MRRLMWAVLFSIVIVVTALYYAGNVMATPANGFSAATLAKGTFGRIDVSNHLVLPKSSEETNRRNIWLSRQETRGASDLYVQSNVWQPGGSTGWHTHPGHSLIIVTQGAVTAYEGHDPNCTPHVYTVGTGFVDAGGDHVHILRNEGSVVAATTAVQVIPAGADRRIDAPNPGHCSF